MVARTAGPVRGPDFEAPNRSEFLKRDPRTTKSVQIFKKGSTNLQIGPNFSKGIHEPQNRSEFFKRVHEPPNRSEFLKRYAGIHEPPNRSQFLKKVCWDPRTAIGPNF